CCRTKERLSLLVEDLKMQIGHGHYVIWTDLSVRVRRRAAAQVAVSIKADDGVRYSEGAEYPLHSRIGHNRTKRCSENRALLLILAQRTFVPRQWLHASQRRRDIELHYLHDAAILSVDHRLLAGLRRRRSRLRKQDNGDCRQAQRHAEQETEFEERGLRGGF